MKKMLNSSASDAFATISAAWEACGAIKDFHLYDIGQDIHTYIHTYIQALNNSAHANLYSINRLIDRRCRLWGIGGDTQELFFHFTVARRTVGHWNGSATRVSDGTAFSATIPGLARHKYEKKKIIMRKVKAEVILKDMNWHGIVLV